MPMPIARPSARRLALWLAPAALALAAPAHAAGTLLIVGGGLSPDNAAVHRAFLQARPADAPGIAIIPSASGAPAESARRFAEALVRHGAAPADIRVVALAMEDDPETPGMDERNWAGNAASAAEIAKIGGVGAIWFTGGDQLRTTRLLAPEGRETPMLAAIRARLAAGAVVGGSSAGAAIMSRAMITEGEPLPALLAPVQRQAALERGEADNRRPGGPLVMGAGLGFLPRGLVDQHFDARRRLGRLARALFELPQAERFGFGIDEDTGLLVDLAAGSGRVVGAAGVTLLDARAARRAPGPRFGASAMRLSLAADGDTVDLATLNITPAPARRPMTPASDPPVVPAGSGGMAVPEPPVAELLADALFAGGPGATLDRPSVGPAGGVRFRFVRGAAARAWSGGGLTLANLGFGIEPLAPLPSGAGQ